MGKYSNVSAKSLLNAATNALNEISSYNFSGPRNDIGYGSYLTSSASKVIRDALNTVATRTNVNGTVPNLRNKLNILKSAANNIIRYQQIEKEIESLRSSLAGSKEPRTSALLRSISQKEKRLKSYERTIDNLLSK